MQLTLWTYEGPPHVGAMRIATAMRDVHYVLHAPQGDTYADLLFTMIERRPPRPPVTYTTFQARDLGGDTAELFKTAAREAYERFKPKALLVGASCTAELIQDDPAARRGAEPADAGDPARAAGLPAQGKLGRRRNLLPAGARAAGPKAPPPGTPARRAPGQRRAATCSARPRSASATATTCGDPRPARALGIDVRVTAPLGATPDDLAAWRGRLQRRALPRDRRARPRSGCSAPSAAEHPHRADRRRRHARVHRRGGARWPASDPRSGAARDASARCPGTARSVDSTYLTGKRVFVFGDATHAIAAARIASEELGFTVVGLGTYSREFAREVREAAKLYGVEPLITDDYLEVEAKVAELQPELVLGTQMERHIAKRLGMPCAVISAPVHVQDFPARYSPQMGFEGANVHVRHLGASADDGPGRAPAEMFRDDFEFHDGARPRTSARPPPRAAGRAAEAAVRREPRCPRAPPRPVAIGRRHVGWAPTPRRNCEDPVLRARQGPPQHRALSPLERGVPPSPSRRSTMPKRTSAADGDAGAPMRSCSSRWTATWPAPRRAPTAAGARAAGLRCRCTPPPNGATTTRRWRAAGRHRAGRHRHRHDAVHGRPLPAGAAGAAGAPRPLRRDGLRDVGRRGDEAHPHGQVRHGRAGQRRRWPAQAAARQASARRAKASKPAPARSR
jgi:light-independent protochlorophyllide reductase subunit B